MSKVSAVQSLLRLRNSGFFFKLFKLFIRRIHSSHGIWLEHVCGTLKTAFKYQWISHTIKQKAWRCEHMSSCPDLLWLDHLINASFVWRVDSGGRAEEPDTRTSCSLTMLWFYLCRRDRITAAPWLIDDFSGVLCEMHSCLFRLQNWKETLKGQSMLNEL